MKKMRERRFLFLSIIVLGVIIIIGAILFMKKSPSHPPSFSPSSLPPSKPKPPSPKPFVPPLPKSIYNVVGVIEEIEKDSIILKANLQKQDDSGKIINYSEYRRAKITSQTKFIKLKFIEIAPGRKAPKEIPISLKDLRKGDYIEVVSNQDVFEEKEFPVIKVRLLK